MPRTQSGNLSAAIIVIAENAQAHRDQPAFFSNENNETNLISILTTHEVSRGDADALIVCSALEFAQNGQTVAEDTGVLIVLVYHWRTTYSSERKAGSQDQGKVQHDRGYKLETTCYLVDSCMKCLGHHFCDIRSWKDVSHGNVEPGIRST